jgi:hypothetical protein
MLSPQRVMEIALKNYHNIKNSVRKRYAEMLVARAVRFYIENELDDYVVEDDLYMFCKNCENEVEIINGKPNCECIYSPSCGKIIIEYSNLEDSEKEESQWQRELQKLKKTTK